MDQQEYLKKIGELNAQQVAVGTEYWRRFSDIGTWPFWLNVVILITPIILLLIYLDRQKIFHILFFGYTVHVLMNFLDAYAGSRGYVAHPYTLLPAMPINLSMNTSLIPVLYMLMYQYAINRNKNVVLFGILASASTGLGFGSVNLAIGYLQLHKGFNLVYLFLVNLVEFLVAYGLTSFFLKFGEMPRDGLTKRKDYPGGVAWVNTRWFRMRNKGKV